MTATSPYLNRPLRTEAEVLATRQDTTINDRPQMLREFSAIGPCIPQGEILSRTAKTITYRDRYSGKIRKRGGWRLETGSLHTEPCRRCRDHDLTTYPDGYQD